MNLLGPFRFFWAAYIFWLAIFGLCVIASAIGVVYSKQLCRSLHIQLQDLQQTRDKLHVEWSRLLLEQGTLASDLRVEQVARGELNMHPPSAQETVVVRP